jgi:hypothetical protein
MPLAEVGPRNARTDPETGLRYYTWRGQEYPSMTSILSVAGGVRFPIHQWAITQVVNRAVDNIGDLNRMLTQDDPKVIKATKTWLRAASTEARDTAADLGTRVHSAVTGNLGAGQVGDDVVPFLKQYRGWLADEQPEILASEQQVFNLTKGYAGSFDHLVRLRDKRIGVVDLKSGSGTYPEHALQVCGYALSEFVGEDDVVNTQSTDWLLNAQFMALLHIRPDGWEWQEVQITGDLIRAFNGMLVYGLWAHKAGNKVDGLLQSSSKGNVLVPA